MTATRHHQPPPATNKTPTRPRLNTSSNFPTPSTNRKVVVCFEAGVSQYGAQLRSSGLISYASGGVGLTVGFVVQLHDRRVPFYARYVYTAFVGVHQSALRVIAIVGTRCRSDVASTKPSLVRVNIWTSDCLTWLTFST
jgi:hypothetical protein